MKRIKKYAKNFTKYMVVGLIWTLLNVVFMWFFIDVFKFTALTGSTIVVFFLVIGKYFAYVFINLIRKNFLKYISTVIGFSLANIFFMWLAVDIMKFSTVISSAVIVATLFMLRFVMFNLIGLVKE